MASSRDGELGRLAIAGGHLSNDQARVCLALVVPGLDLAEVARRKGLLSPAQAEGLRRRLGGQSTPGPSSQGPVTMGPSYAPAPTGAFQGRAPDFRARLGARRGTPFASAERGCWLSAAPPRRVHRRL